MTRTHLRPSRRVARAFRERPFLLTAYEIDITTLARATTPCECCLSYCNPELDDDNRPIDRASLAERRRHQRRPISMARRACAGQAQDGGDGPWMIRPSLDRRRGRA